MGCTISTSLSPSRISEQKRRRSAPPFGNDIALVPYGLVTMSSDATMTAAHRSDSERLNRAITTKFGINLLRPVASAKPQTARRCTV
jgi:hypothetical protein